MPIPVKRVTGPASTTEKSGALRKRSSTQPIEIFGLEIGVGTTYQATIKSTDRVEILGHLGRNAASGPTKQTRWLVVWGSAVLS